MGEELAKNVYEQTLEKIKELNGLKDKVFNNEFVGLAGDLFKVVSFFRNANEIIVNKKFNAFLRGFSEEEVPTEKEIGKLMKYIDDESKAEFISDTFSKILLSNSSKACLLMGTLLKLMVDEGGELKHEKLICISALTSFFDADLHNFKLFFEFLDAEATRKNKPNQKKYKNVYIGRLKEFANQRGIGYSSLLLTIDKSISSQLIMRSYEADISVEYDKNTDTTDVDRNDIDELYSITEAGLILHKYMGRIPL